MRKFPSVLKRFAKDERGVFAVIFGVMAIALVAMAGAVVDFVSLQQARNRAQVALDASALALQPRIFDEDVSETDLLALAQALVVERVGNADRITATVDDVAINIEEGSLILYASLIVPTYFVELIGMPELRASLLSEATRKKLDLEVVMVLDNSGSMAQQSRMANLKIAAECATYILFYDTVDDDCNPPAGAEPKDNVKIGIVPFTLMVNIGTQFEDETWLDWDGISPQSWLNFDNDDNDETPFTGPVNRRTLFDQTDTNWNGCVEARQSPYDTNDTEPTTPETLFVPFFSPDTTANMGDSNNYLSDFGGTCQVKTCTVNYEERNCRNTWYGRVCDSPRNYRYTRTIGSTTTNLGTTTCVPADYTTISSSQSMSGSTRNTTAVVSLLSPVELQERLCKYNSDNLYSGRSPNQYCPSVTVLPMTHDVDDVTDSIDDMTANGNTNIQQGSVWGLHALTSAEPLTEGEDDDNGSVSKVMIIMTDGKNEPIMQSSRNVSVYFSWGFGKDGRLAANPNDVNTSGEMQAVMDEKTVATCAAAKSAGITVYTIGLDPPNAATQDMLEDCSSGAGFAFFPEEASDLEDTFRTIAAQLAQLRLAQ